ncbi:hypothetical protein MNEG_7776, partial [Monoraphidium neglectum]
AIRPPTTPSPYWRRPRATLRWHTSPSRAPPCHTLLCFPGTPAVSCTSPHPTSCMPRRSRRRRRRRRTCSTSSPRRRSQMAGSQTAAGTTTTTA